MICVYISDEKIKLVEGDARGNKIIVQRFYDISTKAGSLESGAIKDTVVFTQALQDCMQATNMKAGKACYVLDNSRMVFREMIVPDVPDAKLKKVITSELFSESKSQNTTLDYIVLEKFKDEKKVSKLRIMVTYINNEIIDNLSVSAVELGLTPVALDIAPNATNKLISLYNSNASDRKLLTKTFVLLDYKDTFISIYIFDNYVSQFTKSSVIYVSDGALDLNYLSNEMSTQLNSTIRYYQSRNPDKNIEAVFVTGNALVLDQIMQSLADSVGLMISHLPLPSFVKGMELIDYNAFTCALGTFIRR